MTDHPEYTLPRPPPVQQTRTTSLDRCRTIATATPHVCAERH